MRHTIFAATICWLFVVTSTLVRAGESESLPLKFDRPIRLLKRGVLPGTDSWRYYITQPKEDTEFVSDEQQVQKYIKFINPAEAKDPTACRLMSRQNYVGLFRLVDERFKNAQSLTWKWSVAKHPRNGKLGGAPHDHAMTFYVFFREPKSGGKFEYTILGFCWTAKSPTTRSDWNRKARMPWRKSPQGDIHNLALRDGPLKGELSEKVDLQEKHKEVFGSKVVPPIWGVVLLGDSNEVVPDVGEMTTDAVIRDIRFHNK